MLKFRIWVISLFWLLQGLGTQASSANPAPLRVLPLAPSLFEKTQELLGPRAAQWIIGKTAGVEGEAWVSSLPSVGMFHQLSLEAVLRLKPDLAIATRNGNSKQQIEQLTRKGVRVVLVSEDTLFNIRKSYEEIALALGVTEQLPAILASWDQALGEARKVQAPHPTRTVLLLEDEPLLAIGSKTYLSELFEVSGAINSLNLGGTYLPVQREVILNARPSQVILVLPSPLSDRHLQAFKSKWAVAGIRPKVFTSQKIFRPTLQSLHEISKIRAELGR